MAASGGELVGAEEGRKKERGKKKILKPKRERLKLEPWWCYIVLSPKAYKFVLSPSPIQDSSPIAYNSP